MATKTEARIYRDAGLCALFLAASLITPQFVPNQEGGLASAASAVLVFLAMLLGAGIFSLFLLKRTLKAYSTISTGARVAGIAPSVVLCGGLLMLIGFLRY